MIDKIAEAAGQGDAARLLLEDDLGSGSPETLGMRPISAATSGEVNPASILAPAAATGSVGKARTHFCHGHRPPVPRQGQASPVWQNFLWQHWSTVDQ